MSLINTDIFHEQLIRSLATHPFKTLALLFKHKLKPAPVKAEFAKRVEIDPETLPFDKYVLKLIEQAKAEGREVILATATHQLVADKIAAHLGCFDAVLATTDTHNCKSAEKLKMIQDYARGRPFDYVGDSSADCIIFEEAETAYVVGDLSYTKPHQRLKKSVHFRPLMKAMRPHQWAKNLLIFLPLLVSHNLVFSSYLAAFIGFICFSLTASAVYLINDMVDVEDDRHHQQKRKRPFAAGQITLPQGGLLALLLLAISFGVSAFLLKEGLIVLALYLVLTFLYSFSFKTKPILDVFCLSTLYAIRLVYGHVITEIAPSPWLLVFCVFFFLSLAFMKRSTELHKSEKNEQRLSARRGYETADGLLVRIAGMSSGLISILVLAFYTTSAQVTMLYLYPEFLWGAAYVLLYWKLRLWLIATRGKMHQDPVVFAIKDKGSYIMGALIILFAALAKGILI